jgi:hypothetical protein
MTAADLNRARDAGDATEASKPKRKRRGGHYEFDVPWAYLPLRQAAPEPTP